MENQFEAICRWCNSAFKCDHEGAIICEDCQKHLDYEDEDDLMDIITEKETRGFV